MDCREDEGKGRRISSRWIWRTRRWPQRPHTGDLEWLPGRWGWLPPSGCLPTIVRPYTLALPSPSRSCWDWDNRTCRAPRTCRRCPTVPTGWCRDRAVSPAPSPPPSSHRRRASAATRPASRLGDPTSWRSEARILRMCSAWVCPRIGSQGLPPTRAQVRDDLIQRFPFIRCPATDIYWYLLSR